MARILIVKPYFPYPPHQGSRRVSLALLADLASAHDVTYLCQLEQREEARLIPELERLGVNVVAPLMPNHASLPHKVFYKIKYTLESRASGLPALCHYWSNGVLRAKLEALGTTFQPDLTLLENWETHRLRSSIRGGIAALLAHDAAYRIRERAVETARTEEEREALASEARDYRLAETDAWRLFDAILCLTEDDRRLTESAIAPDGIPVRHLPVSAPGELFDAVRPAQPGLRVGFMGSYRADFNLDALAYLLDEIWPALQAQVPAAQLIFAGNGYEGPLKQRALDAGAVWRGFVQELPDFFNEIDLLLVPLRFGGGVRIRILEALAAEMPIVASSVAVAGLDVEHRRHCVVADGGDATATAAAELLANPERARMMGTVGREWCRAHHGPEVLRPARLAVVAEILARGGTR